LQKSVPTVFDRSSIKVEWEFQLLLLIKEDMISSEKLHMIDLHTHILPGVDDGAKTIEQSLFMVKQAEKAGITAICATPHILHQVTPQLEEKINRSFDLLKTKMAQAGCKVSLALGSEIYVREDISSLKNFRFFTLNNTGKYLLVELPWGQFPPHVDQIVFELQMERRIPIIAHPERSMITKKRLVNVENLVQKGALMQINAGSLLGLFGRKVKSITEELLRRDLVHFIASDAHDHLSCSIEILPQAFTCASKIIGREKAEELVVSNPRQVIQGGKVTGSSMPFLFENIEEEQVYNSINS
jgi:protein-tyrosine phosphatase